MNEDERVCTIDQRSDATVVSVSGDLDVMSAPIVREALIASLAANPSGHLVVDLSDVRFLDSTGIGVIVAAHTRATANDGRLTTVVGHPSVHRVLEVTGLLKALRVEASVEEALSD
jgi:anti-anti-sigma factor